MPSSGALNQNNSSDISVETNSKQSPFDFFEHFFAQSNSIILVADSASYKIIHANQPAKDHLGDVVGQICWQVIQGQTESPCTKCSPHNDRHYGSQSYETSHLASGRWFNVLEWPITLPDGRNARVHIISDITAQKRHIETLEDDKRIYQTVADYTYDWECWLNAEGKLEYISPSCERITGHTTAEFMAHPNLLSNIIHPQDRKDFLAHHEGEFFTTPTPQHIQYRIIKKNGEICWLSHFCQPVYAQDGTFQGRRSSDRDITARIHAEKQTKLNEQRLSLLLQLYDKKVLTTKEICDFVLDASLPLTSSPLGFFGFLDPYETELTIHAWSRNIMEECSVHDSPLSFSVEGSGLWAEGIRRKQPFMINNFSQYSGKTKGTPEGHIKINRYLTVPLVIDGKTVAMIGVSNKEEPYTKEDTRQLQLLLEGMWQILSRKKAEKESLQHSEKVQHLARAISHDLKNPAVSSYGFAQLLMKKYENRLDERALNYIEQILRSTEQISSLAEDINIFTATREAPLTFEPIDLLEILDTTRQEFILQLKDRNIKWIEPEIKEIQIIANKLGLLRVYRNIIENALKYGGEELSTIFMGYQTSRTHHILSIGNDGRRIPIEDEKIIFKEFTRSKRNSHIIGTGLGLSIVTEIAKKHKGESWVASREDGNPVFFISISQKLKP